jgi:hypothetical protein
MEMVTMPRPMRWLWGSVGAYWLTDAINPGFFSVAVMALVMIPILIVDFYFPPHTVESKPKAD